MFWEQPQNTRKQRTAWSIDKMENQGQSITRYFIKARSGQWLNEYFRYSLHVVLICLQVFMSDHYKI